MENLIFDIGFHKGEDTLFYLLKGYRVIAVDADPNLINEWQHILEEIETLVELQMVFGPI